MLLLFLFSATRQGLPVKYVVPFPTKKDIPFPPPFHRYSALHVIPSLGVNKVFSPPFLRRRPSPSPFPLGPILSPQRSPFPSTFSFFRKEPKWNGWLSSFFFFFSSRRRFLFLPPPQNRPASCPEDTNGKSSFSLFGKAVFLPFFFCCFCDFSLPRREPEQDSFPFFGGIERFPLLSPPFF